MQILVWLHEAIIGLRGYLLVGLIIADVVLAIGAALFKTKKFNWRKTGDFYESMVLPRLLGYLVFYLGLKGLEIGLFKVEWFAENLKWLVDPGIVWAAWVALVAPIGLSIGEHVLVIYGGDVVERVRKKLGQ